MAKNKWFRFFRKKNLVDIQQLEYLIDQREESSMSARQLAKNHIWVHIAADILQRCIMRSEYDVLENGIKKSTRFDPLFDKAGGNTPPSALFMKSMMWWCWEGEFFWYWGDDYVMGIPSNILVLDPRKVYISNVDGKKKFFYTNASGVRVPMLDGEFLHVYKPNIYNPDRGVFPLYNTGDHLLRQDELINSGNVDSLDNGPIPDVVVKTKQRLTASQASEAEEVWSRVYGKKKGKRKVAVLGNGAEVQTISQDLIKYIDLLDWNRTTILAAYGIPLKVANAETGKTALSGKDSNEQYIALWSQTVLPTLTFFEGQINRQFFNSIGYKNVEGRFNIDKVPELQEDENEVHKRDNADIVTGVVTINEIRKIRGLDPVSWGNVPPDIRVEGV
jgi:HK97 family phage portal protein